MKIQIPKAMKFGLLLCASWQMAAAEESSIVAREQAQSYFEAGEPAKAVAVLAEAAEKSPQDHAVGGMLYAALRDHLWHLPQILPVRQKGAIKALTFNPDGTKLASGAANGEVLVLTTEPLEEEEAAKQRVTLQQDGEVIGLSFSRDGKHLFVASKTGPAKVWNLATAKPDFTGPAPDGEITAFDVANGTNLVAIGTSTGAIQVLDIGAAKVLAEWKVPGGKIQTLVLSHEGKKIATGGGDRTARVWNIETKAEIGKGIAHEGTILSVDFSYDDRYLLSGGEDQAAKLSDPEEGVQVVPVMKCGAVVRKASVSPDGSFIATLLDDSSVVIWDAFTGAKSPIILREDAALNDFLWSRSGLRSSTISQDGHVTLWTMHNGARLGEPMPHDGPVVTQALSEDSKVLAAGTSDGVIRVWRTDGGMPMPTVRVHSARARSAFYSDDGQHLITTSEDHTALHWLSGHVRPFGKALIHRGKVTCGVFNSDASRILTCDDSGIAQLWNAATGQADGAPYQHKGPVNWVDFHPDGQRLVTVSGALATVWSVEDRRKPVATIKHAGKGKSELKSARFSPNGRWLATASTDGTAQIWDAKTYQPVAKIERHFPVLCVRFSRDSGRLVVGGEDAQAAVYSTSNWMPVGVPVLAPGPVFSAAITEDNQALVISSLLLDAVQFFEVYTGRALGDGLMIPAQATCVDYMPLDKVVVVACDDGTVRALGTPFVEQDVPPWMPSFAQRVVGLKKTGPDAFERVDADLGQLRNYTAGAAAASNFDFPRLVRWLLMTGNKRSGLPRFTSTLAANIDLRVDERSVDALYECYEAVPGGPMVTAALSLYLKNRRQGEFLADQVLHRPDADPLARCFAANTLVQAGRAAEAEVAITKALADAPEDPRVLCRVAKFHARLLHKEKAIELFDKATKIEPDNSETRRAYAWALYNFGMPAEAAAHFHLAEDLAGPMNDDLIAGICLSAAAQKNATEAKAAFKRLVDLDPEWRKAAYLTDLRGWTQNELRELERVRQTLYPGK